MDDVLTKRLITHDEASDAVQRLVNSHFGKEPKGRFGIPARPDYDDDLVLSAYIKQQRAEIKVLQDEVSDLNGLIEAYRKWARECPILETKNR